MEIYFVFNQWLFSYYLSTYFYLNALNFTSISVDCTYICYTSIYIYPGLASKKLDYQMIQSIEFRYRADFFLTIMTVCNLRKQSWKIVFVYQKALIWIFYTSFLLQNNFCKFTALEHKFKKWLLKTRF